MESRFQPVESWDFIVNSQYPEEVSGLFNALTLPVNGLSVKHLKHVEFDQSHCDPDFWD